MPVVSSFIHERAFADDRLLNVREAANLLHISIRKINTMLSKGELPRLKIGRSTRVRLSDIMRLIREGTR